jgi:hypothetical protein
MDFGDLFKKENKNLCRWLGTICVGLPLLYILAGGFVQSFEGIAGWFREWFVVGLSLMFFLGIIFLLAGLGKRKPDDEEA